jgi:hypothetical protein
LRAPRNTHVPTEIPQRIQLDNVVEPVKRAAVLRIHSGRNKCNHVSVRKNTNRKNRASGIKSDGFRASEPTGHRNSRESSRSVGVKKPSCIARVIHRKQARFRPRGFRNRDAIEPSERVRDKQMARRRKGKENFPIVSNCRAN